MKQVININFQGRVVPIEVTAYDLLKNYTESLSRHFANEEGKEEIINDIESRIGELFQERITKGATCITDDDVKAIIKSMGNPEDFEAMDDTQPSSSSASYQEQPGTTSAGGHRRLFRNENDKVLGGVCSGLANYFNIDVVVARIIFVILLFSGIGFLTYIIMWIAVPSSSTVQIGGTRRKLFRDADEKMIAGVCSGIGNYFGINPWIPRVLFLLPFLSFLSRWGHWGGFWDFGDVIRFTFSPTSLIVYIILWIVIPEAITTSEKLEMKGEKVDLNSIKASVTEEMKNVGKRAEKFSKEAASTITEKANTVAGDVKNFGRRSRGGLGNVIAMIAKIFAYFIIGCVCFGLFAALIALLGVSFKVYPLKDYLLSSNWQNVFAWGTIIFFLIVPVVGLIIWLIRKLSKSRGGSRVLTMTFISLWIIGWACVVGLVTSVGRDFDRKSKLDAQEIVMTNPKIDKLIITSSSPFEKTNKRFRWTRFDSFDEFLDEDTLTIQNIKIRIVPSPNDSFHVLVLKEARGYSREEADRLASRIDFNIQQVDSLLVLDRGININKIDKFRNQNVFVIINVPVGKQIRVKNDYYRRIYFNSFLRIDDYDQDDYNYDDFRWQSDVDYVMKADGLYTLDGRRADGWNDKKKQTKMTRSIEDGYRYNEYDKKADSLRNLQELRKQNKLDSIERVKEKLDSIKEKIENSDNTEPLSSLNRSSVYDPMVEIN